MRIEDFWYDGVLYEIQSRNSQSDQPLYLFCYTYSNIKENPKKIINNLNYSIIKNNNKEIYENEIYEVLVEKELLDNKVSNDNFLHSVYRVVFIGKPNKKKIKIEKILVLNRFNTEKKVRELVKEKFSKVIEVISVDYENNVII